MVKKNLVFEEIDSTSELNRKTMIMDDPYVSSITKKQSILWLSILLVMIICMVVVGGMTRLTDSGLSIVEWKPITGILFPLTNEQWIIEFEKYKLIPEFSLVNSDMTMPEFKNIFFWEWGHRQLGRAIGLVWIIGFSWLAIKRQIPAGWPRKFLLLGFLIGLQGAIGWWMVYSGLMPEMTDVASYRLATHLGMAFCIVGLILWFILSLRLTVESVMVSRRSRDKKLYFYMKVYLFALFLQILLGALVAGIDAGTAYTDWPLMAGDFFPSEYWAFEGVFYNLLESPAAVQFNHRMSAYFLLIVGVLTLSYSRKNPINFLKYSHALLFVTLFLQIVLGIVTVTYGAPYQIAIVHQLLALVLWLLAVWVFFETAYPRRQILT
ncbi:MAG: COX15/CtaA family protein [Paracoccaceae bacterium]|nr:COX15/CtaA family protein [Paracoccaceae bacterium]